MPPKKKASPKKKVSAKKAGAPKKATKKKAAPKKKTAARKESAPKTKAASKKAAPKKAATGSSTSKKGKSKDTPTIFKVKTKKAGPSSFTLDDVQALLKDKKKKEVAAKKAPSKKAAEKKKEADGAEPEIKVEKRNLGAASINDILGGGFSSGSVTAEEQDEEKVPKKWRKYYRALIELRDHFTDELKLHTSETLKRSSREDSGDLSGYGQHQADAGTDTFDRDLALSMVSNEQDALYEIDQAIKRIFDGTYGICEITEQSISKARLTAVPFTRYSVEGQAQWERMNRKKVERGGVFADADDGPTLTSSDDDDD